MPTKTTPKKANATPEVQSPDLKIVDVQRTKIVATIGPASNSYENLKALAMAGVNVFRLNFSHGSHADHQEVIDRIVRLNAEHGTHVGILADLQGPKLRVGQMEDDGLELKEGDEITFVDEPCLGTRKAVYMSYKNFARDVKVGEKVLVDDGKLVFEVVKTDGESTAVLKTLFGGVLKSNKGVNLPNTKISLPSLTEKDLADLKYILTQPVNWIALSFVRSPKDIKDLVRRIEKAKHPAKVIAKIEKPEAVEKIDKIIKFSNAIMVARGDLGIEVPMEELPRIQKDIIRKCIQRARPVIVATQMMDSMITAPSPTRAEISDVANAVLDGADAVMLSGETSVGRHPVRVVEAMNKILEETERYQRSLPHPFRPEPSPKSRTFVSDVVCFNAAKTAEDLGATAIIGMTASGYTGFKVSSYRPQVDIYIFSDQMHMLATLSLVWGVRTYYYDRLTTTDETIHDVGQILKAAGRVNEGDLVVNTASMPIHERHRTNMLKVSMID